VIIHLNEYSNKIKTAFSLKKKNPSVVETINFSTFLEYAIAAIIYHSKFAFFKTVLSKIILPNLANIPILNVEKKIIKTPKPNI
jgi:hypothetical protein